MNRLEVEDDSLFISNSEVLRILEKHQSEPGAGGCLKRDASLQDLHTVEKEVLIHLRKSRRCLSKEEIKSCMALFDEYKLPISEKLVLLNIQPSNIAELHPVSFLFFQNKKHALAKIAFSPHFGQCHT